ncbi:zonadhesin-like isoform X1 [Juglans microcarpa x Juglans regia]|uniref:zonadhesin-like isoform X1 n=2 Tax=Juglans microcarpa x Juglans regia TaxID=2249226 RepID=UPI001B7F2308|nr:zonadhesin-like isoform X1 [Juglans microcarpa x Juglans regia]
MNRSFRAQESQMPAAMRLRQQQLALRASMMKEKDEELALFLEMKKCDKERNDLLLNNSEDFDAPLGSNPGTSPIFNISSSMPAPARKTGADDFLNSENDKNDYDWLLTPPGTPLFPSLEVESQKTVRSQLGTPKARPTVLKSRLANLQPEPTTRSNLVSKQAASSPGFKTSITGTRRPSSSGGPGSRPATPTGRPTLTTGSKPSRSSTPTSRATLLSTKPAVVTTTSTIPATKYTVPATKSTVPLTKSTVPAVKPTVPARSSTPLSRSTARSSTPTARTTLPPSKSTSRAATPTRRPSTPSSVTSVSAPLTKSSSSVSKPAPMTSRNPVPSRGTSPTVKSRPWKPSEMPGFSLDAPPNLRTSVLDRPLSATRGRPGQPSSRSSSIEPGSNGRPRRQSCSPSRGRVSNGMLHGSGSSVPAVNRGYSKVNDNVSPGLVGTKMVERVINMRKLAPPKQDDKHSSYSNLSGKSSSSPDGLGFGRTLSKKSLDMAIRHMDIRRSIPGNLRPLMTNIPASSMYSVRSGPALSRAISVSDSPLATSSNASSEVSVNNNGLCLYGSELEDDIGSDRGGRSPARMHGRTLKLAKSKPSLSPIGLQVYVE